MRSSDVATVAEPYETETVPGKARRLRRCVTSTVPMVDSSSSSDFTLFGPALNTMARVVSPRNDKRKYPLMLSEFAVVMIRCTSRTWSSADTVMVCCSGTPSSVYHSNL